VDYLTKGLPHDIFEHLRKLVQGWQLTSCIE
jgi:hypothetical protein